ncbi:GNAT family N-acetyltransferase [Endozoicomonas sp. G2_1]|uniref:GNAT family N-acetyltransferase n=1 Tax=Endozoicomonas sp. G2_1 TaxID=2821091 RepID=UPI001ADD3FB6|nr:GNAT family N-acetyltransferase [Endozoicomonas sp. G2_1]MBO9490514.1 GNAT family N-acetyltransferase [Endozoicomonas sp. G2_1]
MSYSVSRVAWQQAAPLLKDLREKVFVCEWRIPKAVEFDRHDKQAIHLLVCDDKTKEPVATGRLRHVGEISRIAVLPNYRKKRVDHIVLKRLVKIAQELGLDEVFLHCPLSSVQHYQEHNFKPAGQVFMEAGIARQKMAGNVNKISMAKYYLTH